MRSRSTARNDDRHMTTRGPRFRLRNGGVLVALFRKGAVGRGQPLAMLEKELGFGMHVGRIDVTRRQLSIKDKRISRELSSGDPARFSAAIEELIERGAIRHGGIEDAVRAILANRSAAKSVDTIVLSSTHRLAEKISEELHEAHKNSRPELTMARIAAFKPKELQPAELLSTASYKPGEMIEYQPAGQKSVRMAEIVEVTAHGVQVKGQLRGAKELISFVRPNFTHIQIAPSDLAAVRLQLQGSFRRHRQLPVIIIFHVCAIDGLLIVKPDPNARTGHDNSEMIPFAESFIRLHQRVLAWRARTIVP